MAEVEANPLISTSRASDTSPHIQLHPLVLLTISDYVTRHTLRQQEGPIVGAILGQQNGREITMEVAFEAKTILGEDGQILMEPEWFQERLEQFKDVYKSPALDLVGWFTFGTLAGPSPHHLPIHENIQAAFNESAILLVFHPSMGASSTGTQQPSGKLPLTLYESFWETSTAANDVDKESKMDVDGETAQKGKKLLFRELAYSVETGEAEMISVDYVARGAGNATAIEQKKPVQTRKEAEADKGKKGKSKAKEEDTNGVVDEAAILSPEDDELLSSLTAKSNAIKMLHSRLYLLQTYLSALPPCYLTDASLPFPTTQLTPTANPSDGLNHQILRSLSSLLSRLPLLSPPDTKSFETESLEQKSDTELISLLSSITNSVQQAKELGRKSNIVVHERQRGKGGMGGMGLSLGGIGDPGMNFEGAMGGMAGMVGGMRYDG